VLEYDLSFEPRAREASASGIYYGAYYLACTESGPEVQADTFLTFLRHTLSKSQPVILIFDWEHIPSAGCAVPEVSADFVLRFAGRIQALTGHLLILYTDARVLKTVRTELEFNPPLAPKLAAMPLWVGRPGASAPKSTDLSPWDRWQFWQFTGMDHRFGMDYFAGSKEDLDTFLKSNAWVAVE
jgi:GH25 family lysozyme M1 (1,4-beta-N-acetylmuramidase)